MNGERPSFAAGHAPSKELSADPKEKAPGGDDVAGLRRGRRRGDNGGSGTEKVHPLGGGDSSESPSFWKRRGAPDETEMTGSSFKKLQAIQEKEHESSASGSGSGSSPHSEPGVGRAGGPGSSSDCGSGSGSRRGYRSGSGSRSDFSRSRSSGSGSAVSWGSFEQITDKRVNEFFEKGTNYQDWIQHPNDSDCAAPCPVQQSTLTEDMLLNAPNASDRWEVRENLWISN
ncbi:hypothetical protein N7508_008056 [Penicillium antarcticum]|nr:uncharacterized protein N7508_008056 [Penicillium antarcticum]KAJ5297807.1 hypothetical protein N7508_008056 [Penicillium antarcticum]